MASEFIRYCTTAFSWFLITIHFERQCKPASATAKPWVWGFCQLHRLDNEVSAKGFGCGLMLVKRI
jgi:hypothetical protein